MLSDQVTQGADRAPHRSLFYAAGFSDEELNKPLIGVVCAQSDIIPGHTHLAKVVYRDGIYLMNPGSVGGCHAREGYGVIEALGGSVNLLLK